MTASEQLDRINTATRKLVESQYNTYNRSLVPLMAANGIHIIEKYEELTAEQAAYVDRYFEEDVYPVLTPMAVDASRPFPLIRNKTLNIAALLSSKKDEKHKDAVEFATVQVPGVLPRLVPIPADTSENSGEVEGRTFILLEQIIEKNIDKLFLSYDVVVFLVKLCILKAGYLDHKLIETDEMTEVNHDLTLFLDTVMLDQLLRLIKAEVDLFLVSRLHLLLVEHLVDFIHIIGINDRISVYLCFKVIDCSGSNGI